MTVVLVHGNPETAAIWRPLVAELAEDDDVVTLSPPGFGAPLPAGFGATVEDYRSWLVAELERFAEPVDLVGHDWGGGHVLNVAMTRPDLLRSWVSDIPGVYEPGYVWHELAQVWQQPGAGERAVAAMFGAPLETRLARLTGLGFDPAVAADVAAAQDADMGRAVLALYRSAAQPAMAELGRELHRAAERPGLAILAEEDHYVGTDDQRRAAAARAGARVAELPGLGHWWMLQDPARGAAVLREFWRTTG